ncbi:MAG: hypothetical protein RSD67_02395 [Oscillospiraceae bacterium]
MQQQIQRKIFKISTDRFKENNWNINLDYNLAFNLDEIIALFDSQCFRFVEKIIKIHKREDYTKLFMAVIIDKKGDFSRATSKKGIIVNGNCFKRFVGTTGGLKGNTLLFVREDILDELNTKCDCGRNKKVPIVPAKYEAYKALCCSSSAEIISPSKILVVSDCFMKFKDNIIQIDDGIDTDEPVMKYLENVELENNVSDGFNLCTIEFMRKIAEKLGLKYIPSGVCLRNAWLKGMLFPFPIKEFADKYCSGNYIVKDIWGNDCDIRDVEMILTASSLKLWKSYDSIDDYMLKYKENGFEFSVTKVAPEKLEDVRTLNYQYLQSYELTDTDITELCRPTVEWLKNALCGDYKSTLDFLGIDKNTISQNFEQALFLDERFMKDPYVIDKVKRLIRKKIDDAKIGKLLCNGNYQIATGDPFALMQHIFGLEVTGLLKSHEVYSKYWVDKNASEIIAMRSPMTSHNNIRKVKVINNEDVSYWYQYMTTILIVNGCDTFCKAENGEDWDGDANYTTDDKILLKNYRELPAISCIQKTASKVIVTEQDILKSNYNGLGNQVGTITNRVSEMIDLLAEFDTNSEEYKTLSYRVLCGQFFQQNAIDKVKGIISKPMPKSWYDIKHCGTDFERRIVANKKPYFFIYNYVDEKQKYNKYMSQNEIKCKTLFGINLAELLAKQNLSTEEQEFIKYYQDGIKFSLGNSTMNKICRYIESQFNNYTILLKEQSDFDYTFMKTDKRCFKEHKERIEQIYHQYLVKTDYFMKTKFANKLDKDEVLSNQDFLKSEFKKMIDVLEYDEKEVLNIILDLCYSNNRSKKFCWDILGAKIIDNLKVVNDVEC